MGKMLDGLRKKASDAERKYQEGIEKAENDVRETQEANRSLEAVPEGVDDEILKGVEQVRAAIREDAAHDMEQIHETIEEGNDLSAEVIDEAGEQAELSREASEAYGEVGSITEFGNASAEENRSLADDMRQQFEDVSEETQQEMQNAEAEYQKNLEEIVG